MSRHFAFPSKDHAMPLLASCPCRRSLLSLIAILSWRLRYCVSAIHLLPSTHRKLHGTKSVMQYQQQVLSVRRSFLFTACCCPGMSHSIAALLDVPRSLWPVKNPRLLTAPSTHLASTLLLRVDSDGLRRLTIATVWAL